MIAVRLELARPEWPSPAAMNAVELYSAADNRPIGPLYYASSRLLE